MTLAWVQPPGRPVRADLLAGLAVAAVLLPESVAYAAIAGVPPLHALTAALVGLVVYFVLGGSRWAVVSPTSSAAAVFATAVATGGPDLGYALVLLTGALFVLAAALRAEFLAAFISRPVLRGFAWALALTIVLRQVPHLLDVPAGGANAYAVLASLWAQRAGIHLPSLALGAGALLLWLVLQRVARGRGLPSALVVLAAGAALTAWPAWAGWGIAEVGALHLDASGPRWPDLTPEQWLHAAQVAPALLLIVFAESWGAVRSLALRSGEAVAATRELGALGGANALSALVQGLPVGAGFSAAQANWVAGARSRWAGLAAAAALGLVLLLGQGVLARLPVPVLAAVVVGILSHALWPRELLASLRLGGDAWLALLAAAGVLVLGVLSGMLLAVGLSAALALARFAQPLAAELGRLPGTRDWLDAARHAELTPPPPGVLVMRPEEPLFFANAEAVLARLRERARAAQARVLVVSLEVCDDLDSSAAEALNEAAVGLRQGGVTLLLARVKDRPRAVLARTPLGAVGMYWSVDDAVAAATAALRAPRDSC